MAVKSTTRKSSLTLLGKTLNDAQATETRQKKTAVAIDKINKFLALVFFLIWILIGSFILLFIYGNAKQGAFRGLLGEKQVTQDQTQQAPTETTLPGIGKVNIECVQSSLSAEAIQKIVADGNTSKLTDDEKAKFEPCIVEKETENLQNSPATSE